MGWLEGLLTGYADTLGEQRRQNAVLAEQSANREGDIYKQLLNSEDPEIRGMAATGLLSSTQPKKLKSGFGGWMGEMQANPMYPQLLQYMKTPKQVGEDVKTTVTTPEQAGYLPTLPPQSQSQPAAQSATQTTTPGAPGPQPTQPTPAAGPPPPPSSIGVAGLGAPPSPVALTGVLPPPAPPAGLLTRTAVGSAHAPAGFPTTPDGTTFVQQLEPPDDSGSNGGHWVDDKGQHWTLDHDQMLKVGERPVAVEGPLQGGPPAMPPGGLVAQLSPDQLRGALAPETKPAPLVQTTRTPIMGLPHAFPTVAESAAAGESAKMHAEVGQLQEEFRLGGAPDWQRKGLEAYLAQHGRGTPGVMEGDSQPVSGPLARQLGVPDGTWMQPLYNKADGTIVHWIPGAEKMAGQKLSIEDEAARAIGYPNSKAIPDAALPAYRTKLNELAAASSGAKAGGTAKGKYDFEMSHVNQADVDMVAKNIMGDFSKSGALLAGKSQAFKNRVTSAITQHGGEVTKISEATRQMAEMAVDIRPVMDKIAEDAAEFNRLGMMGPIQGRWQDFLTGKIGVTELTADADPKKHAQKVALAGKFRTEVDLLQKAVLRAHAGARGAGSPEGLDRMEGMLNAAHMDLGTFLSSMSGFKLWMDQYASHLTLPRWGTGTEQEPETPESPLAPALPASLAGPQAEQTIAALHQKYSTSPAAPGLSPQFTAPLLYDSVTGRAKQ